MALHQSYPLTFEIKDFSLGHDNINEPTTKDPRTFTDIKNYNLTRRRGIEKRGGISELYDETAGAGIDITGLYEYKSPSGNDYMLVATDTYIKSYYNAKWNNLKTGLTAGKKYSFETHRGLCYGVNGIDDNFKLRNTTSHVVGIAPPTGAPKVAAGTAGTESLYTNWGEAHIDYIGEHKQNAARTMLAQSFMLNRDYSVSSVKLKCRKIGTPTNHITVEIHSDQEGTIVGAASAAVAVPTSADFATKTFTLGTAASCSKNTTYYIIIKRDQAVSDTNFVEFGFDWEGGYADGQYFEIDASGNWDTSFSDVDLGFEVWGTQVGAETQLEYGAKDTGEYAGLRRARGSLLFAYESYLLAQSFQLPNARDITSIKLALKRHGDATGNVWVELHSSKTGTSGTKDASTNMVLNGSSASVDVSGISADSEWVTFTFSGTKPSLSASTTYYLVLYCDYTEGVANYVQWTSNTNTYTSGKLWRITEALAWTAWDLYEPGMDEPDTDEKDASFRIYGIYTTAEAAESHSDITQIRDLRETNSQQMIVQSFTVDESGSCPYVKVYMSKTGSPTTNLWAEIHDSPVGTLPSKSPVSPGIVGSASANVTIATGVSSLPTFGWVTFTFGTDPPLIAGNTYYLVIYGDYAVSKSDFVNIALDKTPPGYNSGYSRYEIDMSEDWTQVPGQDIIFEVYLTTTGLANTYYYCYTYKRTGWLATESNPSNISDSVAPSTQDVDVRMDASTDTTQVDKIVLWRTLADETTPFYKVIELDNPTATITGAGIAFVDSDPDTITDTGSGFVDAGFMEGDIIQVTNATQAANNITFTIASVVAGTITLISTDEVTTEAADATEVTIAAVGKLYNDSTSDNALNLLWDETNGVPPKATFIKLHKDTMFYANCPDEDEGKSLIMWSKSGNAEVVPSANYQYFDKDDGEEVTGVASLGTFFFVFKPNKIGVLDIEAPEIWYLGYGIGCIAPWAILTLKDKIIFLSEEGWKATDGADIWDLSENISGYLGDGYVTIKEKENYSVAFYPEKEHFEFLMNHNTLDTRVVVGHFLVPLILKPTGISELVKQNIMGWTYHEYDYDELTCIGNYTDSDGITRVIAGASDGFVYLLDSGTDDDGEVITTKLQTDWLSLARPESETKTIRKGHLGYKTSGTIDLNFIVDIDYEATNETSTFTGGDVGINDSINEKFDMTGTGELFRFTLIESSTESLSIMGVVINFRSEGVR